MYSLLSRKVFKDYANKINIPAKFQKVYDDSEERF